MYVGAGVEIWECGTHHSLRKEEKAAVEEVHNGVNINGLDQ